VAFISTRGRASAAPFSKVILNGLAPDGGLYVPLLLPQPDLIAIKQLKGCRLRHDSSSTSVQWRWRRGGIARWSRV
jgi:threonine synthase